MIVDVEKSWQDIQDTCLAWLVSPEKNRQQPLPVACQVREGSFAPPTMAISGFYRPAGMLAVLFGAD